MPGLSHVLLAVLAAAPVPRHKAVVDVVDADGAAVRGIAVALSREGVSPDPRRRVERTDGNGRAHFHDVVEGARLEARVLVPWSLSARVPTTGSESATIQLPPTAGLDVTIHGCEPETLVYLVADGERDYWTLDVRAHVTSPGYRRHIVRRAVQDGPAATVDAEGRASFPVVGVGRSVRAIAVRPSGESAVWTVDGPREAGVNETRELIWQPAYPVLDAQLVGLDATLEPVLARWRARSKDEALLPASFFTSFPRLRLAFDPGWAGEEDLVVDLEYRTKDGRRWQGRLTCPGTLVAGETRLDAVRIEPMRPLVTGSVVDDFGRPVSGAQVSLDDGDGRMISYATTDALGRFEAYAFASSSERRLYVDCSDFLSWSGVAEIGSELEVVLRRHVDVEGRLMLPAGVPARLFELEIESDDEFRYASVKPSTYDFRMTCMRSGPGRLGARLLTDLVDGHLGVSDGDFLVERALTLPPRRDGGAVDIGELDVRPVLHTIRVAVVDADGAPVDGVQLRVQDASVVTSEPLVVVTDESAIRIEARAQGYIGVTREGVEEDVVIVLEKEQ